jgi:hypothetical protein
METIDFGSFPNDANADSIRAAFAKTQNNITELYSVAINGVTGIVASTGLTQTLDLGSVVLAANIATVTLRTDNNLLVGTGGVALSNSATINQGGTPFVISLANTISTVNVVATGNLVGRLASNSSSQPNITTVGTLTALTSAGDITAPTFLGNVTAALVDAATYTSPSGNTNILYNKQGTIGGSSELSWNETTLNVIGNITSQNIAAGNLLTANYVTGTLTTAAQPNVTSTGTLTSLVVSGNIEASDASLGNAVTANYFIGSGNNLSNIQAANISGTVATASSADFAAAASFADLSTQSLTVISTAQPNITSVGTLSQLSVTSTATVGNLVTTGNIIVDQDLSTGNLTVAEDTRLSNMFAVSITTASITGNGMGLVNLSANSIIGIVSNASHSESANIANSAVTASIVTAASQPAITSVGDLDSLYVVGPIVTAASASLGNSAIANYFVGNGDYISNIQAANVIGTVGSANVSYNSAISLFDFAPSSVGSGTYYVNFASDPTGDLPIKTNPYISFNADLGYLYAPNISILENISAPSIVTNLLTTNAITTGDSATQGTLTGNWQLTAGSVFATIGADLAEYYAADKNIEPGTVVEFGGEYEITTCNTAMSNRIAGVVTTDPSYVMNTNINCEFPVAVALQGRVPVRVTGTIHKGDMIVSAGEGIATAFTSPMIGTVIGKSLENFSGSSGIIEVAIGRI